MSHRQLAALPVLVLGVLALLQHWLAPRRPAPVDLRAPRQLVVTSSSDHGPGSLRQALITAGSSPARTRIVVNVQSIVLDDPLPPLVNPLGIVVEAGAAGCEIDARRLLTGSAFDIVAPDSTLAGLTLRNAPSHAVLVRADRVRLTHLELSDNAEGVRVADAVTGLVIVDNTFRANGIGIRFGAPGEGTVVRRNHFSLSEDAGISALRGEPLVGADSVLRVEHNRFAQDRISLVLGNVPVLVEDNEIDAPFEVAIFLTGSGATVRGNRIRGAVRGIVAENLSGGRIVGNDIGGGQVAVLVSAPAGVVIEGNRLYDNLAGITMILADPSRPGDVSTNLLLGSLDAGIVLVASSPDLRGNRSLGHGAAGLRLTDYERADGVLVRAEPRLENNDLAGDGIGMLRDVAQGPEEKR